MKAVAKVKSVALVGLQGSLVTVEAAAGRQLPGMAIVGLPDAALNEAKHRVKHAAGAIGLSLTDQFVLINLHPAELPKHGSSFDLAVALAALAALSKVSLDNNAELIHLGELSLDGSLRRPRGLLASVVAAKRLGFHSVMVPAEAADEAALVPGINVIAAQSLQGAVNWCLEISGGWQHIQSASGLNHERQAPLAKNAVDVSDVFGQEAALEGLEIAAAGRHHMHMMGPPGAGKTMLASSLSTILPDLAVEDAISATSIKALSANVPLKRLLLRPPFESPHHTATTPAIIGSTAGGLVRPGAISRASKGVLFLDEAQEFPPVVLDALRQPLEKGYIEINRAALQAVLPADFQLILASNPCPCGNAGSVKTIEFCSCTPNQLRRYAGKLSGPLRDRIDLRIFVDRVRHINDQHRELKLTSQVMRERVIAARSAAAERFSKEPWNLNSQIPGAALRTGRYRLSKDTTRVLDLALEVGKLTLRGYDRTLRLSWSCADLLGKEIPGRSEIAKALDLREGGA